MLDKLAVAICHRNTGAGSDGIAVLERLDGSEADYHCEIVNPDGSGTLDPTFNCQTPSSADTLAFDADGNVYVATGIGIFRYDPNGTLLGYVGPGANQVRMGPDGYLIDHSEKCSVRFRPVAVRNNFHP